MTMRADAFVFESQRLFARLGERSGRHDSKFVVGISGSYGGHAGEYEPAARRGH